MRSIIGAACAALPARRMSLQLLVVAAWSACFSGGTTMHDAARILALGDSYTIGEAVAEHERFPSQLTTRLRERGIRVSDPEIVARTGWTTEELSAAIDDANPSGPFDLVTLLVGVNNQYRGGTNETYREEFAALLRRAIAFADGDSRRVIVISIPDWGVTPFAVAQQRDASRVAREIDAFNAIARQEAASLRVRFVDITPRSRDAAHDQSLLTADGLHPSAKLYGEWAQTLLPMAEEILGERGAR